MLRCDKCGYFAFGVGEADMMEGHIRNVHGWPTPPSVHSTPPGRCEYALPGLGRCVDTSGTVHGHHFKPGQLDPALVLTLEEARVLVEYLSTLPVPSKIVAVEPKPLGPVIIEMLMRLHAHVRVTA